MKDKNITPGQMRFVWRFMETRALVVVAFFVGAALGWLAAFAAA